MINVNTAVVGTEFVLIIPKAQYPVPSGRCIAVLEGRLSPKIGQDILKFSVRGYTVLADLKDYCNTWFLEEIKGP